MKILALPLKLLVLVALILNGTAAHSIHVLAVSTSDSSYIRTGSPTCHSAVDPDGSARGAPHDRDSNPQGDDPPEHECGGIGCACACVHHTPPLALFGAALGLLASTPSMPATPRVGFHSLTPLPLLRPPIA